MAASPTSMGANGVNSGQHRHPNGITNGKVAPTSPLALQNNHNNNGGGREVEQRFARIVAEYEYKLLEERGRAQEREARLLEELQQEKANCERLASERLHGQPQGQEQSRSGLLVPNQTPREALVSKEEHDALRQQLLETRELLHEAERRYQQEKRELLNLRTAQLRNETSKRGQEGDIIARAMQVMSEYETVVRQSEEDSLARLSRHMEAFEQEWVRRSREFEEQKVSFEAAAIEKTRQTLMEHQHDVECISRALLEKTTQALRSQSDVRLEMEEQVMRHAEIFKEEYKAILEKEFYDRCRMYDEKIAERERGWIKVLQEERKKIVAAEQRAVKEHEALHVQALEDAMRDLSRLREQLVQEHQEQQTEAMKELMTRREALQRDHEELISNMNKKTQEMQRECAASVAEVQEKMKELHISMAAKEADMMQSLSEAEQRVEQAALTQGQQIRCEVEKHWTTMLEKERSRHMANVQQLTNDYQNTIDRMRGEQIERESALLASYESRVMEVEEAAEYRWNSRVEEAMRGLERHMEVVQMLRHDNETMTARIASLTQEVQLKGAELEGSVGRARREQDAMWHQKIEAMRQRYDKLLDEALNDSEIVGGSTRPSRADYEQAIRSVKEWEEKCVTLKQQGELRLEQEREHLHALWGKRLEEERAQRVEWEAEKLQHFASLREALLKDVELREQKALEAQRLESDAMHEALLQQQRDERRRCDAIISQAQQEAAERCAAAHKSQLDAIQEAERELEARNTQREAALQQREEMLQQASLHMATEAQTKALYYLQKERVAMQVIIDKNLAELHDEQQQWEAQRSMLQQQLAAQYADQFNMAKSEMQQHLIAVMKTMLSYQEQCQANWLQSREEELEEFSKERVAYMQRMQLQWSSDVARMQKKAEATLHAEREALDERERVLWENLHVNQKAMEDSATQRAMRLLEEQQRILSEANQKNEQNEQKKWESLQNSMLKKTWEMEAAQRSTVQHLQSEHETVLEKERQRWRAEFEQRHAETQVQRQQLVDQFRQQEAMLTKSHNTAMEEERLRHNSLMAEMRKEFDRRLAEEKEHGEVALHERESMFDAERKRLLERIEKQRCEMQVSANERVQLLQEEYGSMMRAVTLKSQQSQQEFVQRVTELEQRHLQQLEEQARELQCKHDESMSVMRESLEMRVRGQATLEAEMQQRLEKQQEVMRNEMGVKYHAFVVEQMERVRAEQQVREENVQRLESTFRDHLVELRGEMEKALSVYLAQCDDRAQEASVQARAEFEKKVHEFCGLAEEERQRRAALEEKLRDAQAQIDSLRLTHEQQKLQVLHEVQEKYERLYKEMHDALRTEREAWARRALGEEEQRLLRELTAREEKRRLYVDASPQSSVAIGRRAPLYEGSPVAHHQIEQEWQQEQQGGMEDSDSHLLRSVHQTPHLRAISEDPPGNIDDDRLRQLWSVHEVPEGEQRQMLRRWAKLPSVQSAVEMKRETRRLELQLPLLEVVTRREFVIHRLKELEKASPKSGTGIRLEELQKELIRLTEHLKTEIPRHEATYGSTFRFRGARYMDVLLGGGSPLLRVQAGGEQVRE